MEHADLSDAIKENVAVSDNTSIIYNYFNGSVDINRRTYRIGQLSFSEVAHAVLDTLRELYGDYTVVPHTFNSEAYENGSFRAEVLALGGLGVLEFSVYKKQVVG